MSNADLLWTIVKKEWPKDQEWITISLAEEFAPQDSAGITIRSSYDFAMLTLLSDRREYIEHENEVAEVEINGEVHIANRNNGIWRKYYHSRIRKT